MPSNSSADYFDHLRSLKREMTFTATIAKTAAAMMTKGMQIFKSGMVAPNASCVIIKKEDEDEEKMSGQRTQKDDAHSIWGGIINN